MLPSAIERLVPKRGLHRPPWSLAASRKLAKEVAQRLSLEPSPSERASEAELRALPAAARSLMSFYGVRAEQPKHWSFRSGWRGRFRMAPDRPWMPLEAIQYNVRRPVARFFHMRVWMNGVVPVLARDTYVEGRGRMLGKVADWITVVDGSGPEFDEGELVTWLNDCILLAPSMLLGPETHWLHMDEKAFEVSFCDGGRTVNARVFVDDRGAPTNFETTNRFLSDPNDPRHPLIRCRWTTPIESWQDIDGRAFPHRARVTWHLPGGDFTYGEFEMVPSALAFDVSPSELVS
jgi:hypothetical protein